MQHGQLSQTSVLTILFKTYQQLGLSLSPQKTTGASDAGFLNSIGIETYCLGDGVESPHCTNEKIKIDNLLKLTEIIEKLMTDF